MTGTDDQLVDLIQEFRREQADVVLERLEMVGRFVEISMPEHLAQGVVMIDQFKQAIVIDVQIQSHHAAHEDRPQRHSRTTVALVDLGRNPLFQQGKERCP